MAATESNQKAKAADFLQRVLETDLSCDICQDVYINPIQLNCSHSFCKFCIYRWLSRHTGCPSCRMTVTWQGENLALRNIVNRLLKETSKEFQKARTITVNQRQEDEQSREGLDRQVAIKDDMSDSDEDIEENNAERIGLFSDSDETEDDEDADDENDDDYNVDDDSNDENVDIEEVSDDEMDQDDDDDVSTSTDSSESEAEFFHSDNDVADLSFFSDTASNSDDTIVIQTDDDDSDNSSVEQISSSDSDQDDDDNDNATEEEETEEEEEEDEEVFEMDSNDDDDDDDDDEEDEFYSHWDRYSEDSNVMYGTSESSEVDSDDSTASYVSESDDDESV